MTVRITKENFKAEAEWALAIKVNEWDRDFGGGFVSRYATADFELAEDAQQFAKEINGSIRKLDVDDCHVLVIFN